MFSTDNIIQVANLRQQGMDNFDKEAERMGRAERRLKDFRPRCRVRKGKHADNLIAGIIG